MPLQHEPRRAALLLQVRRAVLHRSRRPPGSAPPLRGRQQLAFQRVREPEPADARRIRHRPLALAAHRASSSSVGSGPFSPVSILARRLSTTFCAAAVPGNSHRRRSCRRPSASRAPPPPPSPAPWPIPGGLLQGEQTPSAEFAGPHSQVLFSGDKALKYRPSPFFVRLAAPPISWRYNCRPTKASVAPSICPDPAVTSSFAATRTAGILVLAVGVDELLGHAAAAVRGPPSAHRLRSAPAASPSRPRVFDRLAHARRSSPSPRPSVPLRTPPCASCRYTWYSCWFTTARKSHSSDGDVASRPLHQTGRLLQPALAHRQLGSRQQTGGIFAAGQGPLHRFAIVDHGDAPRRGPQLEGRAIHLFVIRENGRNGPCGLTGTVSATSSPIGDPA